MDELLNIQDMIFEIREQRVMIDVIWLIFTKFPLKP